MLSSNSHGWITFVFLLSFTGILGGGFPLGSLVMVMEDPEAPHHMLLLRNFMSQGLIHNQPLLYASPSKDPKAFLGTLPSPVSSKDEKSRNTDAEKVPVLSLCLTPILPLSLSTLWCKMETCISLSRRRMDWGLLGNTKSILETINRTWMVNVVSLSRVAILLLPQFGPLLVGSFLMWNWIQSKLKWSFVDIKHLWIKCFCL